MSQELNSFTYIIFTQAPHLTNALLDLVYLNRIHQEEVEEEIVGVEKEIVTDVKKIFRGRGR